MLSGTSISILGAGFTAIGLRTTVPSAPVNVIPPNAHSSIIESSVLANVIVKLALPFGATTKLPDSVSTPSPSKVFTVADIPSGTSKETT